MKTDKQEFEEALGGCFVQLGKTLGSFLLLAFSAIYGGFVTMYLWNGIVATAFSVTTLTLAQATGIDLLISFMTMQRIDNDNKGLVYQFWYVVFVNTLVWLTGWIIMFFI